MINLKPLDDGFHLTCDDEERETIDKMMKKYPRKLEQMIEKFLVERKNNIREAENILIMRHMSDADRIARLKEIDVVTGELINKESEEK